MNDLRAIRIVVSLYFSFAIPFLLAVAGLRLLLSEQFLQFEYGRPGFPADPFGFTAEDRLKYGPYAVNYIFNGESIDYLAALRLPADDCWKAAAGASDCALFGKRELQHLADVKRTTTAAFALAICCALIAVAITVAGRRNERLRSAIMAAVRRGCKLTLLSVACLSLVAMTTWDQAFEVFHELLFADGTWRFPFSDSLIRLYPEQLFIDAAMFVALFASLCAAALLYCSHFRSNGLRR